jgi:2-polyprenyl-6-methoxyphenol hydroxylase-like FAD-dependent oxidoreductase
VDKAVFPRNKVCGGCLNGAAIETLNKLGLGHVLSGAVPLRDVRIGAGRRAATVTLSRGLALSRETLDDRLVQEAVKQGASFQPATVAKLGRALEDAHEVFLNTAPVRTRIVILATGLASGDSHQDPNSRIGGGVIVPAAGAGRFYQPGTIFMATGRHGYVGLVRVEDDRLDVATALDARLVKSHGGLASGAVSILRDVSWPIPPGLADAPWKGTPALTRRPSAVAAHRVFRVGDAAGYVEPFTGEGMGWAVMSAAALAPIAARAAEHWDEGEALNWQKEHRRLLSSRQRFCRLVARTLRSPSLCRLAVRVLGAFPVLARPVIVGLNRPSQFPSAKAP